MEVQATPAAEQTQPASFVQDPEHPSPETEFPSSLEKKLAGCQKLVSLTIVRSLRSSDHRKRQGLLEKN
jgi:hypothetical protein